MSKISPKGPVQPKKYRYRKSNIKLTGWEGDSLEGYCQRSGRKKATVIRQLLKDAFLGLVVRKDGRNYFE